MPLLSISLSIWSTGPAVRMRLNCAVHAHAAVDLQDTQWKAERTLWAGLALARLLCVAAILGAVMAIDHADPTGVNLARPCRHACKCAPYAARRQSEENRTLGTPRVIRIPAMDHVATLPVGQSSCPNRPAQNCPARPMPALCPASKSKNTTALMPVPSAGSLCAAIRMCCIAHSAGAIRSTAHAGQQLGS